jgi:hypothetical protein
MLFSAPPPPRPPAPSHISVNYSAKPAYALDFKQNDPTQSKQAHRPHHIEEFARLACLLLHDRLLSVWVSFTAADPARCARRLIVSVSTVTFTGRNACFVWRQLLWQWRSGATD